MKCLIFIFSVLFYSWGISQDRPTFSNEREANNYAFSNSNLSELTTGYLLDYLNDDNHNELIDFWANQKNNAYNSTTDILTVLKLMEKCDVKTTDGFNVDSVLFPVLDSYYAVSPDGDMDLPLFVIDMEFSELKQAQKDIIQSWSSSNPFQPFLSSNFGKENAFVGSIFLDSVINDYLHIYWDSTQTYFSNKSRRIDSVFVSIGKTRIHLESGQRFSLESILNNGKPITKFLFEFKFNNGDIERRKQGVAYSKSSKSKVISLFGDEMALNSFQSPALYYSIAYGCSDKGNVLDKPYILVNGWGPHTDKHLINTNQEWPASREKLLASYNEGGFVESLVSMGYDVIMTRLDPPNADVRFNALQLVQLIRYINHVKQNENSSYEENIIQGYSAGAMAVRLALNEMEKNHLENGAPHHHTKLYVSFDGEHGGANVPLSMQHAVDYLRREWMVGSLNKIYALNYILNAPLSKNLLKYFHTKTGVSSSLPGHGHDEARSDYFISLWSSVHDKAWHNPTYPAFTRNISVSNGAHKSSIEGNFSTHPPYPSEEGFSPFWQYGSLRKWKMRFSASSAPNITMDQRTVWKFERKKWGNWNIIEERVTGNNCLVLDNAPGGSIFLHQQNPMHTIMKQLRNKLPPSPDFIDDNPQATVFCFTPTLLTHDIKNFDPTQTFGRMEYDMKQKGLMYQDKFSAENNLLNNASDYFGYPHLKSPDNHYTTLTPFDAVFASPYNTVHIVSKRINPDTRTAYIDGVQNEVKWFVLNETDFQYAFLQNKRYGWNAREDQVYKAEIHVPREIFIGKEVTQRTNFKPVEVWSNADVSCRSEKQVIIQDGFHAKAGSKFHAYIAPHDCGNFKNVSSFSSNSTDVISEGEDVIKTVELKERQDAFSLYPNPNKESHETTLLLNDARSKQSFFKVFSLAGREVLQGQTVNGQATFELSKGVYIVEVETPNGWQSKKLIVL